MMPFRADPGPGSHKHTEFNSFVQRVQAEAAGLCMEYRFEPHGQQSIFSVYWDGRWHRLAGETPFSLTDEERQAWCNEDLWLTILARAGAALATS